MQDVSAARKRVAAPVCLFVEDDAAAREFGAKQLQSLGLEVVVAKDGSAALKELVTLRPDLLVTDLCMPGMDGITLTRLVRKLMPSLPVVACSAIYPEESGAAREMVRAGAAGFLPKPLQARALRDLVCSVVELRSGATTPEGAGGLIELPGVGAEFAYEQLMRARTKTHVTTVALLRMAGRKHVEVRVPPSFVLPGERMLVQLRGQILVDEDMVKLTGRVGLTVSRELPASAAGHRVLAEVSTATSVDAWEALREYFRLRS